MRTQPAANPTIQILDHGHRKIDVPDFPRAYLLSAHEPNAFILVDWTGHSRGKYIVDHGKNATLVQWYPYANSRTAILAEGQQTPEIKRLQALIAAAIELVPIHP